MIFKKLIRSFRCAGKGLAHLTLYERNFKIHLVALACVIIWVSYFKFSFIESAIMLIAASMVLVTEAFNSALEVLLDIIYPEHNGKTRIIKDVMAGGVLIAAIFSVVVGSLVIWHHFA